MSNSTIVVPAPTTAFSTGHPSPAVQPATAVFTMPDAQPAVARADCQQPLRVLFLGMKGAFSRTVLDLLLAKNMDICGILLAAPRASASTREIDVLPLLPKQPSTADSRNSDALSLPVLNPFVDQNIIHRAWSHDIPIYEVGQLTAPKTNALIASLAPDVACVACFTRRIPTSLMAIPIHGFLNVHPSLLPVYRGPSPLFWIFRDGMQHETGVTVHWLDEGLDTGDIAAQTKLSLPDGISGSQADVACARVGGQLLYDVLRTLAAGTATRQPQPTGGSYQPQPQADDFVLSTAWSAQRAFNFMRGTAEWGRPYRVRVENEWLTLSAAVSFAEDGIAEARSAPAGRHVTISFARGVLYAQLRA